MQIEWQPFTEASRYKATTSNFSLIATAFFEAGLACPFNPNPVITHNEKRPRPQNLWVVL